MYEYMIVYVYMAVPWLNIEISLARIRGPGLTHSHTRRLLPQQPLRSGTRDELVRRRARLATGAEPGPGGRVPRVMEASD